MVIVLTERGKEICREIVNEAFEENPTAVKKLAEALEVDIDFLLDKPQGYAQTKRLEDALKHL